MKKDIFFKSICYVDGSVHGLRSNVLNWSWFVTLYLDDSVKVLHNFCGGFLTLHGNTCLKEMREISTRAKGKKVGRLGTSEIFLRNWTNKCSIVIDANLSLTLMINQRVILPVFQINRYP